MTRIEKNMKNLCDIKTKFTIGDSGMFKGKKHRYWYSYHKSDGNFHHVTLMGTYVILLINSNIFSVVQALKRVFQVISERY